MTRRAGDDVRHVPLRHDGMMDTLKLTDNRRWCSWSRRLFFLLVLGAVLFFYTTDIKEMAPDWSSKWWLKHKTANWFPFKSGAEPELADEFAAQTNGTLIPPTANITSTNETDTISQTLQDVKTKEETQEMTPAPPPPVPYVSPGPYLVEYPYEYHFVINEPKKCEEEKPFLVLVVPVAPHNRAHRDVIRSTWGGESLVRDKVVKLFFLLGLQTGEGAEQLRDQLLQESKEHGDLIQSDFLDCYKNLTIKTMVMLEWLDAYCSGATYAMKIDSDMFLNVPKLIEMLLTAPRTNYMTGLVARGAPVLRDRSSKWYLPPELYAAAQYPRYALGLGYVLSLDLPKKLVEASRHVKAVCLH
ncbi:hypothetical protein L3Q82_008490 [Scortum barcoo]|uniref:Uncharacterized protein n=1 Tax=Scortum barcoo TaxID=214431 RepID=A0ACB8XEM7_9TELE|nr:hypothetical protein L3Q82_008490 [Scortum barcoo]